uniref:von Willebrand factor n=1 Tax=Periophthalmus magnuspinnatus TaxID=409849 RepID=A0A3B4BK09_9GOBI
SLFGRQHIHTFDGVLYDFPGDCSYLLAGDCTQRSFTDFVNGKRVGITLFLGEAFELHMSVDGILSQGEKSLSVPYASHSLFVGTELGFYKLWSEEFGFSVTIDNAANVAVTLSEQHVNRTCGLCGNYNAITADEYTAQEDSYDFANSWAAKGVGQTCQRVTPPTQTCNSTQRTTEILSGCSVLGQSSVFLHCAHVVPPEGFVALCQQEACHCEGAPEDCSCPVLLEYARTCHAHGVVLTGWTAQSQCPKCPIGMQYSECTKSCSTTCHSLNIQEVCTEECSDGCTCPGKVLDGKRCVEVSLCSCVHMGRHFPPGSTISQDCNTSVCRHGSWECTNEGCPECLVLGQSHFKTFDDKFFTFTGQCHFLLAKDCAENEFSVIIENVQCADEQDAVCTRSVTLSLPSLENMTIKLKHGGLVSVNSMDIQTPIHHHLHIQRLVQSAVHVRFREDFQMEWDGRGRLRLKGHTCGLCGNYNGNQGDDFLSGSGLVEGGAQAFGQSWRINGDCEAIHRQEGDPCASNPKRVRFAEEACSVIMSEVFSPCHFLVNPAPFQRFCRYDVCACTDGEECFCSALAAYASTCSARGVLLNWRSPSLCLYEACGRTCERTCRSLSGGEYGCGAESVCEEGCFCPPGKYLTESGQCVTSDLCPCLHDGQLYQPQDVYADHHVIHCENGAMHCSSTEEGAMLSDMFFDDDLAPSRRRSAQCAPPLVRADCGASGGTGLECARTCQNMNLPCVSTACIPGCLCPLGTQVRHRRDCIAPEECPCYHNNRPYASGQTITMECNTVCQKAKWQCTDKVCDGVCHTVGEGHYITFDGLKYSFPGFCQYVLDMCGGEEGSFRVLVENEACGIVGHRCAKAITIYFQGGVIVMQNGEVKMKKPVLLDSQVQVVRSGHSYTVLLGKHIFLSWDRGTHLRVHVSAGKVCGLCGNYDGYVNNDLMSSNKQLEVDAPHFGNSWKVVPSCADLPVPCNDNMVKLVTVEQSCRVLTGPIFKECNSQVQIDAEPYVDMCIEAACSCPSVGDCACFCDVVAAYALACSEQGLSVSWRSNQLCLSCEDLNPKSADTGEELCQWRYNACGPACPISCQHPEPLHCSLTCVEGCHVHCPPQLLDEVLLRCVEPSQCQVCVHDGQTISHGTKILLNQEDPDKWLFKKTVRELHYTGGDAAFLDEAIKYLAINIYDKNKREHAGRVAIILTASENPRSMRAILKLLRRKSITTLTVALGPGVDMAQINEITKVSPDNRAYILSSTGELNDRLLEVTDYLCTLGLEPEVDKPKTTFTTTSTTTTTTSATTTTTATPNLPKSSTKPAAFSPTTSPLSPLPPTKDLTFIVEGSDAVGEANFNKSLTFLEEVITQLTQEKEEVIRITVIQYSVTVTIEISHWEIRWHKQRLVERLREIRWRGGNKTNTGAAVTTVLQQMATAPPTGPTSPPQLVFLVTENPPTDIIPRPTHNTQTHFYPIGVGPKVKEMDLFPLSSPQRPLMVEHYFNLTNIVHHVINITKTTILPRSPTLPPLVLPTLPPSPCDKPMDILFLLKAGEQLTDAKTFVKTFIMNAKITLRFAIQTSLSPASGGRAGAAKIVVMVILDKSTDDVKEAANEALAAVSMFPIGVGPGYDRAELSMLGHHGTQDNSLHLSSMDQLLLLLTLDHGYTERMGPPGMCVDDNGTERKPGELWLLEDGCHSLLCHPSGAVTVQSHKVSCDSMEPPACTNNMPMCMGSSTNHVVRFDGLAIMLQLKSDHGYTLTFTPHSNEFTITMLSSSSSGGVEGDEGVCVPRKRLLCGLGVSMGCQALRSEVFAPCHSVVPVQLFLSRCEEQVCEQSDVCEVLTAYAQMCRQNGACVHWRGPHLCFQCPSPMEYHACRSGCVEDCRSIQTLAEERNSTSCVDTPTEGCYCAEGMVLHQGVCVSPDSCTQCVDQQGHTYMQSWVPEENPCLICLCLDQQRINCTARPCNDIKPVCGPCEILREKRESKCCPEYECKKEQCDLQPPPTCPPYRQLSVKKTTCCDAFECKCKCQNSTRSCPTGFITSTSTNDCGCTVTTCEPDKVGEVWPSPLDQCVLQECVKVHEQVFVTEKNVSCSAMDTPFCPLGSELHCAKEGCCPFCHPVEACLFNNTLIGPGEHLMVDPCTHCECQVETEAVRKFKLSCKRTSCPECPMACCGHCVATTCFIQKTDGTLSSLPVNSTREEGCNLYSCSLSPQGDLVAQVKVTTCPAFDSQGTVSPLGDSCVEPECQKTKGTLNYIRVDDCQSEQQVELHYCELQGKCRSRSLYSLERGAVEKECVCCSALDTQALSVPVVCDNGTRSLQTVLSVTKCDCVSRHCD